jgi:signal transduction histidine kinase
MTSAPTLAAAMVREHPVEALAGLAAMAALALVAALLLRRRTAHLRSLRTQFLTITVVSLLIGAAGSVVLARLMVLDDDTALAVVAVLAVTAMFAVALIVFATEPLARDLARVERQIRSIEHGELDHHTAVHRADELGRLAVAVDSLAVRLDASETARVANEAQRRELLSNISHDLRTPLTAMRAAVEALADGLAPDPDRYLRSMLHDLDALSALIDDLFLLSRLDAGQAGLQLDTIDLVDVAEAAMDALAPLAATRAVTLRCDAATAVHARGDAAAIARVIRNLLDNAIRHAPAGSAVVVGVGVEPDGSARVCVDDAGPGFPVEFADRAFERFARADLSRARASGGTGLGLAIARGLVEAHGGRIWIEQGAGGRVRFAVPLGTA